MTPEEVEMFARGLYYLASRDGIDERETELIAEFLTDAESELTVERLSETPDAFDPVEAALLFETTNMRRVFLRAAVALVRADGVYSDAERRAMGEIADAFGLSNTEFSMLEQDASQDNLLDDN